MPGDLKKFTYTNVGHLVHFTACSDINSAVRVRQYDNVLQRAFIGRPGRPGGPGAGYLVAHCSFELVLEFV